MKPECRLLILSAADDTALAGRVAGLARAAAGLSAADVEDVGFTLATGRRAFAHRAAAVLPAGRDPLDALRSLSLEQCERGVARPGAADVVMMFPGQGSQFVGMGRELYEQHPGFREVVDRAEAFAAPRLGRSLRDLVIFGDPTGADSEALKQTAIAQPALFVIEYALAEVLRGYGIRPALVIGHSIGEYAAACVAGVFELEQALELVLERGRLMQSMPPGSMLAVRSEPEALAGLLDDSVSLAAHNAPGLSVVSGPSAAVERFAARAAELGLETQPLHTSHAFHSAMMDPILPELSAAVARLGAQAPRIPLVSGLTGEVLDEGQARSPEYWANQLRYPVQFARGVARLCEREARVLLEVGPGTALLTSAAKHAGGVRPRRLLETLGHPKQARPAFEATLRCLGRSWIEGVEVDWNAVYDAPARRLVRLPTYPYTRSRHWLSVPKSTAAHGSATAAAANGSATDTANVAAEPAVAAPPSVRSRLQAVLSGRLGRPLEPGELERHFIELGFDSLALTQLSGKLRQEFSVRVPFRRFFDDLLTPALLASYLEKETNAGAAADEAKAVTTDAAAPPPPRPSGEPKPAPESRGGSALAAVAEREAAPRSTRSAHGGRAAEIAPALPQTQPEPRRAPPTPTQREIWIACSVGGQAANLAYNECRALTLTGNLDVGALTAALAEISKRHEALRQTFSSDGAVCITGDEPIRLEQIDLTLLEEDVRRDKLEALKAWQTATPFDLERGPLVRVQLVQLGKDSYVLLFCAHHIVVDGYSFGLLTRELAELYSARVERRPAALEPADSFAQYAAEENAYVESPAAESDRAFWLEHLRGQTEDLTLPTDAPRPAQRSYRSTRLDFALDAGLVARLRELSAQSSMTLQTLLMASFQLLMHRVSRQADLVLGVPTSGQVAVGADALVGHCVHTLPVRTLIDPATSFAAHAHKLSETLLDCLEHQRTTFSDLLPGLGRARDPSRIPLIQVAFGMGRSQKRPSFSGLSAKLGVVPRISENFELYVYVTEDADALEVSWSYNRELFSAESIAHWQRCFGALLTDLLDAGTERRLDDVEILDRDDRQRVLELAHGPRVERAAHVPVWQRIAARASEHPERIALIDASGEHTYAALDRRAERIARRLAALALPPGSLVAVCLDRSVDLPAALLGVWRAGFGYVPLDPAYPANRIEMILEDSAAPVVLTSRALSERLPADRKQVLLEELDERAAGAEPSGELELTTALRSPSDIAYVIFTSGSTGRPKGVAIQQGAFENFILSMQKEPGFAEGDRLIAITTISFDIAGLELFLPLVCGGQIVMATREQASDPRELERLLSAHAINVMQATPATWQLLFDSGWHGDSRLKVLCGGEAFPRHLAEKFLASCGEIWNVYGPTETTVWSTAKRVTEAAALTIGRPIDNTTVYVLDDRQRLVPIGTSGELWIGGGGVALGYLGRPDLTSERFVPSPFDPNDRIYKTGDLARLRHDGELECLGRSDFQVKIRGFRIELGEIETAISKHPSVATTVVVAREDEPGDKQLVAYLVPKTGHSIELGALKAELAGALPTYMLPAAYVVLDALPMTPNNKVDRKALPAPAPSDGYTPPEAVERRPAAEVLWEEVWTDAAASSEPAPPANWLVLLDDEGVGELLVSGLRSRGHTVTTLRSRDRYHELGEADYALNPELGRDDFVRLVERLDSVGRIPDRVVHLWLLGDRTRHRAASSSYHRNQEHGLYTLLYLAGALSQKVPERSIAHTLVVSHLLGERPTPEHREQAGVLGAARVVPNELARQQVRTLDYDLADDVRSAKTRRKLVDDLLHELLQGGAEAKVRFRERRREVPVFRRRSLAPASHAVASGCALVVGLGDVALASARVLAREPGVRVVLVHAPAAPGDAELEAASALERQGVLAARFGADTASRSDLGPLLRRIETAHGPIRTLVLAPPAPASLWMRDANESDIESRLSSSVHTSLTLERLLPPGQLELSVIATSLDACLGAPATLAEAAAIGFLEHGLRGHSGRRLVCHVGPIATERPRETSATDRHVQRDRAYFEQSGLTAAELDAALASAFRSPSATLAMSAFDLPAYHARLLLSSAKDEGSGKVFVEPATETERSLSRLWADALRLERVSTRDSFFDLGGHSLLAARVFARMQTELGVALPLSVLIEAPTIESLAAHVDAARGGARPETATGHRYLVRLHTGTDANAAPLFMVAGATGNILNLRHLAKICDPRRTFYGIQARGLTGEEPPHQSLLDAARDYLEEVKQVQPEGPYYLGGFCIGGVTALEMARILKAEGHEIGLLALLDASIPGERERLDARDRAQIQLERLRDGGVEYVREWALHKYSYVSRRLRRKLGITTDAVGDPTQFLSEQMLEAIMKTRDTYVPQFFDGHVTVFRPPLAPRHRLAGGRIIDKNRAFLREDNGWTGWVRSLELIELDCPPGEHDGFVLEPYVRDLARRMRALLPP